MGVRRGVVSVTPQLTHAFTVTFNNKGSMPVYQPFLYSFSVGVIEGASPDAHGGTEYQPFAGMRKSISMPGYSAPRAQGRSRIPAPPSGAVIVPAGERGRWPPVVKDGCHGDASISSMQGLQLPYTRTIHAVTMLACMLGDRSESGEPEGHDSR